MTRVVRFDVRERFDEKELVRWSCHWWKPALRRLPGASIGNGL